MAFTVNDFHDLTNILASHPEWRDEMRRLMLTDELLTVPQTVRELAVAQQRTEQRVEELAAAQRRTEQRVEELAAAQRRTEQQVARLIEAQKQTEERLQRLETAVAELTKTVKALSETVQSLSETVKGMMTRLNRLDGWRVETRYKEQAAGYFGQWLRRVRIVWPGELDEHLEDQLYDVLSRQERSDVLRLDAIIRGKAYELADQPEVYLAVEASLTIELNDVTRARRRAELLSRLGVHAIPVVAGEAIDAEAEMEANRTAVAILENGHSQGWEAALAAL